MGELLGSGLIEPGPREAQWLVEEADRRAATPEDAASIALQLAARRAGGEPLQYVMGTAAFRHIEVAVGPGVLIPRPETELLVDFAVARLPSGGSLVDVGTGSGAIALSVKQERPDALVWATDNSDDALRYAHANRARLDLDVEILHGELLGPLPRVLHGAVDVVVCNPPYVAECERRTLPHDVVAHEPHGALFAGGDGTAVLRRLASEARPWLRPGGALVCEIGYGQAALVAEMFESFGYGEIRVHPDLAGRDRFVEGRKAAASEYDNG